MKRLILPLVILLATQLVFAQDSLRHVILPIRTTIHFLSPEPVQYVDISGQQVAGDLALPNMLRVKLKDSTTHFSGAVLTITGESFVTQFRLVPGPQTDRTLITIEPQETRPLEIAGIGFNQNQLHSIALNIVSHKPEHREEQAKAYGITGRLNHLYSIGEYIFLDLSYRNATRLAFKIDEFRFKIEDKKVTKASNIQSLEMKPLYVLDTQPGFCRSYRNVFVFKKMTFPGDKVFKVELSEKQVSGRVNTLTISYRDILHADNLPD